MSKKYSYVRNLLIITPPHPQKQGKGRIFRHVTTITGGASSARRGIACVRL